MKAIYKRKDMFWFKVLINFVYDFLVVLFLGLYWSRVSCKGGMSRVEMFFLWLLERKKKINIRKELNIFFIVIFFVVDFI